MDQERISIAEAKLIQQQLREKLLLAEQDPVVRTIGGADISLNLYSTTIYAGILVLSFPELRPVACALVQGETRFPYVPGYLAFREAPALVQARALLPEPPDVLIVDGHGIAHPRRMGIAAHFGALTDQPSVGCAKKILFGKYAEPGPGTGDASPILDGSEQIGYALRSKKNTAPVFISPGHRIGMQDSLRLIRACLGKYRIPEPTRLAHELVNRFRKGEISAGFHWL